MAPVSTNATYRGQKLKHLHGPGRPCLGGERQNLCHLGFYAQLFSDLLVSLVVLEHFLFIDFREREREREISICCSTY